MNTHQQSRLKRNRIYKASKDFYANFDIDSDLLKKIRRAYTYQRRHAEVIRKIPFLITFDEFVNFWKDDWHLRGRGAESLCMARYGDTGAYSIDNVFKCTNRQNGIDQWRFKKTKNK